MTPAPVAEPNKPVWKNPWAIAFLVGMAALTVLRFSQQAFLHAPPPGPSLGAWELRTLEGAAFSAASLKGRVWIVSLASEPDAQERFGSILRHIEDLGDRIMLVSLVTPGSGVPVRAAGAEQRWVVLTGPPAQLEALVMGHLRPAFADFPPTLTAHVDAGTTLSDFAKLSAFGVIDQSGKVRGFWTGRGRMPRRFTQ